MKSNTIIGAVGLAMAAGMIAGAAVWLVSRQFAGPWADLNGVLACLVAGFFTLLLVFPKVQSDA